eukprot:CAMPEP_0183735168 /NCGR_PEP_ID=MMETSP0737-20130205/45899_1 /TAXON_ID=385413 /ORGANISM="Thalassiosira miniscula, Strain CCMP1093" /LENGTH=283 /DNA_ID=CAMNT_0025968835 /DNA_START=560 /DNA_END=1408 /DNA_ORIENTATION=+
MDNTSDKDLNEKIIPRMNSFDYESSMTMVLLSSPQCIAENVHFRNALLHCRDREVLRLVAVDEVHLYSLHGGFRDVIRILKRDFFSKLNKGFKEYDPLFLGTTAALPLPLTRSFPSLTHTDWTKPYHILRSTPSEFQQRYISMQLILQPEVGQHGLPTLAELLREDNDAHACIFVNFVSECAKWARELENKLSDEQMHVGVLQISGEMDKNDKNAFTRLFTSAVRIKDFSPRVLVATSAANTGIDQVLVKWVLTVGLPCCLTTLLQERGRNRFAGVYLNMTDW